MKIIIAGAYAIGTHLARLLSRSKEDITLIDDSEERLASIGSDYDLLTMVGQPTSLKILRDANVADADEYDGEVAVHAENGGDLPAQAGDVVAVTLLAEFSEAAEVLPYLGGGQRHLPAELAGGDAVHTRGLELVQLAQVARQTPYNVVGYLELFHFFPPSSFSILLKESCQISV